MRADLGEISSQTYRTRMVRGDGLEFSDMRGIEFEVVWFDQDVIEYRVTCSNGSFGGATRLYSSHVDLTKAADILSGFPSNIKDFRNLRLGTFAPELAGGGIDMTFKCVDSAGHAVVLVTLRDDGREAICQPQSVNLCIPVEAGSIDSFVTKVHSIDDVVGAKAYLHMADHTVRWVQRGFPNLRR